MGSWPSEDGDKIRRGFKNLRTPMMSATVALCLGIPQLYAFTQVFYEFKLVLDNLVTSCPTIISLTKIMLVWGHRQGNIFLSNIFQVQF